MKSYLDNTEKNIHDFVIQMKSLNKIDANTENSIKNIEATIAKLKVDLTGNQDEILEKIVNDDMSFFSHKQERDRNMSQYLNKKKINYNYNANVNNNVNLNIKEKTKENYYSKSPVNASSNQTQLPMLVDKNSSIYEKNDKNFSNSMNMKRNKNI